MVRKIISKKKNGDIWDCQVEYPEGTVIKVLMSEADMKFCEIEEFISESLRINLNLRDTKWLMKKIEDYGQQKYNEACQDTGACERL